MKFEETKLNGSFLVSLDLKIDERGFFARYFCEKEFLKFNLNTHWVQVNNSFSNNVATLRGLHFQKEPFAEIKLIRCIKGSIWDVIVDLRMNSSTFGDWFGAELNEENRNMMYVPKGFAHGFISLQQDSEIIYMVSGRYEPNFEHTLKWNDKNIGIVWPLLPQVISDKDKCGKSFRELINAGVI
jgi:dTDP-4-dehydrorhamnose 3,5-epimerase